MKEEDIAVNLEVFYRMKHNRNDYQNVSYSITNEYRGPFAYKSDDFRAFVSNSTHFHLVYTIASKTIPGINLDTFDSYYWTIYQDFDFTQRNILILRIKAERTYYDSEYTNNYFWDRYYWLTAI